MNKFFDIKFNFIDKDTRYNDDILDEKNYDLKLNILGPIKKALLQGHKVEVVRSLKANGENTQISYCKELSAWIVCSKNVCVLARSIEDLNLYKKLRYNYACLMAECWFDIIGKMDKKEVE